VEKTGTFGGTEPPVPLARPPAMSSSRRRSLKFEKLARIYDREILPIWSHRFGRMLLRGLDVPERGQVLDVVCGTGYPATEVLRRMGDSSRLIAIDASSAMLDIARKKISKTGHKGVFFRTESAEPRLSFADDVYDIVVCNLGLMDMEQPARALADFARVTKPGGEVRVTLPIAGTFDEFHDLYREVLVKHDRPDALQRLNDHVAAEYPTPEVLEGWLQSAGLAQYNIEVDEFSLLFKSSREFFFAPVIEYGPLIKWKEVAGRGQDLQDIFWYIKEAIDAYFADRAFEVTVKACCVVGSKGAEAAPVLSASPGLVDVAADAVGAVDDDEVDVRTDEVSLEDLEMLDYGDDDPTEAGELEAFRDGAERPEHLS
jgi:ubiquinone/menaquinone biosynthesis C-methylase UbiE